MYLKFDLNTLYVPSCKITFTPKAEFKYMFTPKAEFKYMFTPKAEFK
jgi:hypothetical protein